jgi:2-succinyl-5-enolpyruvyl-6-hydroxy-3-cyclohexene-1-carboxylate synthase
VHDAVPAGSLLFLGSSSVARDLHLGVARPRPDVAPVTSRGLAGIDGCVSTAVGLALARSQPTYALLGDLTFLHDANGLLIGPDEPIPDLTVVVADDDGGSIFDTLEYGAPEFAGPRRRIFTTPTGTDIETLCAAHGIPATTARTEAELADLVRSPATGIRVIRVPIRPGTRRAAGERTRSLVAAALT